MEKAMAPHSSTLAWKIPWTEKPGRLQSMGAAKSQTKLSYWTELSHFHTVRAFSWGPNPQSPLVRTRFTLDYLFQGYHFSDTFFPTFLFLVSVSSYRHAVFSHNNFSKVFFQPRNLSSFFAIYPCPDSLNSDSIVWLPDNCFFSNVQASCSDGMGGYLCFMAKLPATYACPLDGHHYRIVAVRTWVGKEFPDTEHCRKEWVYEEQRAEIMWALRVQQASSSSQARGSQCFLWVCDHAQPLSHGRLFSSPHQAHLSMGFPR